MDITYLPMLRVQMRWSEAGIRSRLSVAIEE